LFSFWGNVLMPRYMGNGAVKLQGLAKLAQLCVLSLFKCFTLQAFQFYADGVIVALASAPVLRLACMPSAVIDTDKLPKGTVAPDIKVG